MPRYWKYFAPLVPWSDVEASDCREADTCQVDLQRDLSIDGKPQRQIGMNVRGQYDADLLLGMVVLRCERKGEQLIPLSCMWADAVVELDTRTPAMDMTLISGASRRI